MVLIRVKKENENDNIGLVEFVHYMPQLLSEEERKEGIIIDFMPEPERIDKKYSIAYYNFETNEIFYKYEDIPLTEEERVKKLEEQNSYQDKLIETNLMANTELFELLLEINNGSLAFNRRNGDLVQNIVDTYIALIKLGKKEVEDVPQIILEKVKLKLENKK